MIYTHHVSITTTAGGAFESDFTSLEMAQAWANHIMAMHGIDIVGGNHYKPRPADAALGHFEDDLEIDPSPNGTCVIDSIDPTAQRIAIQWAAADKFALEQVDLNDRAKYLDWKFDPKTSPERRAKVIAVAEWMDAVWMHYYVVKGTIEAGGEAVFDPSTLPPRPYSFQDIATTP